MHQYFPYKQCISISFRNNATVFLFKRMLWEEVVTSEVKFLHKDYLFSVKVKLYCSDSPHLVWFIWGSFEVHLRFIWGSFEVHLRFIWGSFEVHLRFIWGSFEVHLRFIWGSFEVHLRCIWGSFEVHLRFIWGAFEVHLRCIWGAFEVHLRCIWGAFEVHLNYSFHPVSRILCTYLYWIPPTSIWWED